jgi:hypothetical protein
LSFVAKWRAGTYAIIAMKNLIYSKTYSTTSLRNILQKHLNCKVKPLDDILAGKNVVLAEPDRILIKD